MTQKSLIAKKKNLRIILKYLNNNKIRKIFIEFKKILNNYENFAVAVSGGPDSLSLSFLSKCFSIKNRAKIKFYIVDHKLRKNSSSEAKLVCSILKKIGITCKVLTWKGKKPTSNIQAVARKKRYSLLINQCKKDNINNLLLGHHIDDLYENFLIRLLRGSGLKGLTSFGNQSKYKINNINILRPLMNFEKDDLIYISKKVFSNYIKDPSNLDENFKRIKIRNLISNLKQEGLDKKKLKLTINNLKDSDTTISFYVKKNIDNNTTFFKNKKTIFIKNIFFEQPNEIVFRSLSFLIKLVGDKYYNVRGKSIQTLVEKIKKDEVRKKTTLGGCFIEKFQETIIISREN
jgi:tRNA(Ile)-lysidine synthase